MIPMLVVPTLTRHDLLSRMLDTVNCPVNHLVVIDNSGEGFELPDGPWNRATVLPMPCNFGVAASWNLAIRMAHREPYVMIASDDVWWPEGAMEGLARISDEDRLVVSGAWPYWCAFTIGMRVVQKVGLFDEGYYPAYYEDTEYERRMGEHGLALTHGPAVGHENASTLNTPGAGFGGPNNATHKSNGALFASGKHHGFDPYRWRAQSWA